jgi:hypothetical protein
MGTQPGYNLTTPSPTYPLTTSRTPPILLWQAQYMSDVQVLFTLLGVAIVVCGIKFVHLECEPDGCCARTLDRVRGGGGAPGRAA